MRSAEVWPMSESDNYYRERIAQELGLRNGRPTLPFRKSIAKWRGIIATSSTRNPIREPTTRA